MPRHLPSRLRAVPTRWLGTGVAAIALGVSALFGGMAPQHDAGPPTVAAGTAIHGQPWDVTVIDGRVLSSQEGLEAATPGDRWFVVIATIDVTAPDSRDDMADILRVRGVAGLRTTAPGQILLARDGTVLSWLNPGMPERVAFCWEQSGAAPLPATVDVDVYTKTYRADSLSGDGDRGTKEWLDPTVVATVHATVQDKRA